MCCFYMCISVLSKSTKFVFMFVNVILKTVFHNDHNKAYVVCHVFTSLVGLNVSVNY